MRKKFNLDLADASRLFMVIEGETGAGKSHFIADMLAYEKTFGEIRYLDAPGEEGWKVAKHFGLGEAGESVETYQDMLDFVGDCKKQRLHALAVDSLRPLYNAIIVSIVGSDRLPDSRSPAKGGDGDFAKSMWGQAGFKMEQLLGKLRYAADIVVCTCPLGKSVNEITGETRIAPDLYGRLSYAAIGAFDFAGYMQVKLIGPGSVRRTVTFAPRGDVLTKQRLPKQITEEIVLPTGPGSWNIVKSKIEAAFA